MHNLLCNWIVTLYRKFVKRKWQIFCQLFLIYNLIITWYIYIHRFAIKLCIYECMYILCICKLFHYIYRMIVVREATSFWQGQEFGATMNCKLASQHTFIYNFNDYYLLQWNLFSPMWMFDFILYISYMY